MGTSFSAPPNAYGFGKSTTAEEVLVNTKANIKGKNVIVTGANTGIGKETAKQLAKYGANVFVGCRDKVAGEKAVNDIVSETGNKNVELIPLDLSSLQSVRDFAQRFNEKNIPLHILILNAGVMACPKLATKEGYELQWGTNHLGHFYLSTLLVESLKKGAPSRVVCVSSLAHKMISNPWNLELFSSGSYYPAYWGAWLAYARSKLSNILFAKEFNDRYKNDGITAYSLHPGSIQSDLQRHMAESSYVAYYLFKTIGARFSKSIPQGAATSVYCAVTPGLEEKSGHYFSDCNEDDPIAWGKDKAKAVELWEYSQKLVSNFENSKN